MYRQLQKIKFLFKAQTAHGLHSPLVFDLYTQLLNPHLQQFKESEFLNDLELYFKGKEEVSSCNLLVINNLIKLTSSEIQKNTILYISNPFENEAKQRMVQEIAADLRWTYLIHFFEGTLLIDAALAPRQVFYLKAMK